MKSNIKSISSAQSLVWNDKTIFSPDNKQLLVSCNRDHTIKLWDIEKAEMVQELVGKDSSDITSVAFSSDGKYIAVGYHNKTVVLWSNETGKVLREFQFKSFAYSLVFSNDNKYILSGSYDGLVRLWETETGDVLKELKGWGGENPFPHHVLTVTFSPDEKYILSGHTNGWIRLWETKTGELLQISEADPNRHHLAFSPDGKYILSGNHDGIIRLWKTEMGKPLLVRNSLQELKAGYSDNQKTSGSVCTSIFSPTGKYILAGMLDGTVKLYETATGKMLREIQKPIEEPCSGRSGIYAISFTADGENIILCYRETIVPDGAPATSSIKIILNNSAQDLTKPERVMFEKNNKQKEYIDELKELKSDVVKNKLDDVKFKDLSLDYTQGEYNLNKYQDIKNNSISDETKIVKRLYDIMMNLSKKTGDNIYNLITSNPDKAGLYYSSIEEEYRQSYEEEYSNLEHKLRVKTLYQGMVIGCDIEGDSLKTIVSMVKDRCHINDIVEYYFQDKDTNKKQMYALENLVESISNWINHLDKIKNIEPLNQKELLLENIKKEIDKVKSLYNEGIDKQDILLSVGFLVESHINYISEHLDDTSTAILGKLDIDYSSILN